MAQQTSTIVLNGEETCTYDDSSWSGISECTCDTPKAAKPPPESPLEILRKEWTKNRHTSNDSQSASADKATLIVLTDSKLLHVDLQTGRSVLLTTFGAYFDSKDFAVWQSQKAIILAKGISGVYMCSTSVNAIGDLDFGCTCDRDCEGRHGIGHSQLDNNRLPPKFKVAVDWVHGLYYWAGHSYDSIGAIGVYEIATKRRRVLFNGRGLKPLNIEVDPIAGYIFWIDDERSTVFRADADGRNTTALISLIGVRSIALDVSARRIYFVDSVIRHLIASADYFGKNVVTILQSCHFISSFTPPILVLNDSVFWAEESTLLSISKNGNETLPKVHHVAQEDIRSLHAWDDSVQPTGVNRCSDHKCAFMCLPRVAAERAVSESNSTRPGLPYSCACALGERSTWVRGKNKCVSDDGGKRSGLAVPL